MGIVKNNENNLWGIILAGGNGNRLKNFTRSLYEYDRPKQYCAFIGSRSMVQHTIDRARMLIDEDRIVTLVTEKHLRFAHEQLKTIVEGNLVVQPWCRETGPAILLPLMKIYRHYPHSVAAIFPSDHFILNELKFMQYIQHANAFINKNPESIVALGVRPDRLEHGYGWIKQGAMVHSSEGFTVYRVESFIEKPKHELPRLSECSKHFWNTLVLIGKTETLLKHFRAATPKLFQSFSSLVSEQTLANEQRVIEMIYLEIAPTNFSQSVMEHITDVLRVVDISDVYWSDWGEEHRIKNDVERFHLNLNSAVGIELEL